MLPQQQVGCTIFLWHLGCIPLKMPDIIVGSTAYSEPDSRDITAGICEGGACTPAACAACTPASVPLVEPGTVTLQHSRFENGGATAIVITLPGPRATPAPALTASERVDSWQQAEEERMVYEPAAARLPSSCMPNTTLTTIAANASRFRTAMATAGLGHRFENAQAGALLQALNASTTRCEGRLSGRIPPLPKQPDAWTAAKYDLRYDQRQVEATFDDNIGRIWRGLNAQVETYRRGNASPEERRVLALFTSGAEPTAAEAAAGGEVVAEQLASVEARIAAAKRRLEELELERESVNT